MKEPLWTFYVGPLEGARDLPWTWDELGRDIAKGFAAMAEKERQRQETIYQLAMHGRMK